MIECYVCGRRDLPLATDRVVPICDPCASSWKIDPLPIPAATPPMHVVNTVTCSGRRKEAGGTVWCGDHAARFINMTTPLCKVHGCTSAQCKC